MADYDAAHYGDVWADIYDEAHPIANLQTAECVNFVKNLAGSGGVLELGIGTGRIAIPLALSGVAVHGIESSDHMLGVLNNKLKSLENVDIGVTSGDFSKTSVDGIFDVALCTLDTLFDLMTQDAQVECFANVAAHLETGGLFVVEAFVPNPARFVGGQTVRARSVHSQRVELEVAQHSDPFTQVVRSQMVRLTQDGLRLFPADARYIWPSEMDLMARITGFVLKERWANWSREPICWNSEGHISVYQKVG